MTVLNKDKILDAAKDFITEGKFDKAVREYEKLLQADPKDMRIKLRIAELFAKIRQIPEAIKAYREVAESYAHDGFYLKAVTVYKNILRLNPSLLDVNQALAALYEKMGLNQDAVHQYEILAQAFEQKNRFDEALKVRQKLVELAPSEGTHRTRLAEAYQRDEKKEEAIEQYELLAKKYKEQKKEPHRLIELYERILPSRPQNKEMLTHLVDLYYQKKDYKAALKWLEQFKQVTSADTHLLGLQAEMYAVLNQLDTARGKYQELAELYMQQGENQKALNAYGEILTLLPEEMETLRPIVEGIQAGAMEVLQKKSQEKRQSKQEEQKLKEEEQEKEKEAKEKARDLEKQKPKLAPQQASATPPFPVKQPPTEKGDVNTLLKKAKSALQLSKAYETTGLESEAKQELSQARDCLKKILTIDSQHAEALQLLKDLGGVPVQAPAPPKNKPEPPKGKKKISFV